MNTASRKVQRIYLSLLLLNTLAASLIWGINTLFLLDAGLSNLEAFAANAFFTLGLILFEIPTGVIADTRGRRASYLLGTLTLIISTLLYLLVWFMAAPFWAWAVTSALLGIGFAFFSGAVEAWLVDALTANGFKGKLESVFAKGEIVTGIAMLTGTVGGGLLAQVTNLGVPYVLRAVILVIALVLAWRIMRDIGFTPIRGKRPLHEVKQVFSNSLTYGLANRRVRWVMLTAPFTGGVTFYAFYAMQPYLLELYGNTEAYAVAGLAAAIIAGSQIIGGVAAPYILRVFRRRTTILLLSMVVSVVTLVFIGLAAHFWVVIALLSVWGIMFAAIMPVRQTYINSLIPSKQRATVLSFDSLLEGSGGVAIQPVLGKSADLWGYPASYVLGGAFQALAIPFAWLARSERTREDIIRSNPPEIKSGPPPDMRPTT